MRLTIPFFALSLALCGAADIDWQFDSIVRSNVARVTSWSLEWFRTNAWRTLTNVVPTISGTNATAQVTVRVPDGSHSFRAIARTAQGSGPASPSVITNIITPGILVSVLSSTNPAGPWGKLATIPPVPGGGQPKFFKVEAIKQ